LDWKNVVFYIEQFARLYFYDDIYTQRVSVCSRRHCVVCAGYHQLANDSLRIDSVAMTHTGIYVCVARNSAGTTMTQVRLHVQGTARLLHQHDAPDREVTAGTIFCQLRYEMAKASLASLDVSILMDVTRLSTVGDRAFPVAGCRPWNSLPPDVTSASTLSVFRNRFKTHLFFRIISFLTVFGF